MIFKALLLLGVVLAVTAIITYGRFAVHMQAGANRFVFTLGFTLVLSIPLLYHLFLGDYLDVISYKTLLILYVPVAFLWYRIEVLKHAKHLVDAEDLL